MSVKENISMIIYSIYKVVNRVNGKVYIGYTDNFKVRQKNHKNSFKLKKSIFHKAIQKHGFENFDWEIIYQSKEKEHTKKIMEQYFIDEYCSMLPYGYNTCKGGGGGIVSQKTIERMMHDNPMKKLRTNRGSFKKGQKPISYEDTDLKKSQTKLGELNPNYQKQGCWDHINTLKFKCQYCDIITTKGNLIRWHNNNCKNKLFYKCT
jgi:group I intron endonuclease